ncbi:MAG: Crp/Fnr family transcriptional regulator [Hyphomicrobiales bacterium]
MTIAAKSVAERGGAKPDRGNDTRRESGGGHVVSPKGVFGGWDHLIRSLQPFRGLPRPDLRAVLRHARIRDFGKGKLLFVEGEPADRLHIVLRGWVKIFKGTVNGEETILHMLGSGEAVLESAVFLNVCFPAAGQVVKDATLLSIPAPCLREHIKNNNELAVNFLNVMSKRSRELIRQIENARAKTAHERLGWFLLKHLLAQGRMSCRVTLPYDKSLIASQLDMRRETLSRVLKRMKAQGFRIENHDVIIPGLRALCGFCDRDTANICALRGRPDCPNPHCDGDTVSG